MHLTLSLLAFLVTFASANPRQEIEPNLRASPTISQAAIGYTTTYTQRITCTKSVAVACHSGRRRRDILAEEQEELSPSPVQGVEATDKARIGGDSILLEMPFEYNHQEIESAMENNDERQNRLAVSFPVATFSAFLQLSLVFVTSTPACSTAGKFYQCPNL